MSSSSEHKAWAIGLKVLGGVIVLSIVNSIFDSLPEWLRALIVILIPFLTVLAYWALKQGGLVSPKVEQLTDRFKVREVPAPWWAKAILIALNAWAVMVIVLGARIAAREHPVIFTLGWLIMLGLVLWLVLDRPSVHESSAWQRARSYNIWGASASRRLGNPDKRRTVESFNERLTRERMEALTAEHAERVERDRKEAESAAQRAREYDAKYSTSEGN